jgi:CheY-like chemotaxis protein/predicted regulator of Ras-like GTPase activity (Roadblock/LC7/MglB family)
VTVTGPKTVLIVDDEDLFLRTVADGFAPHASRVNVLTAPNGALAAEILGRCSVDLVVTDLKMPEMDGLELIAYMSRHCPSVPVVVMTAFGTPEGETRVTSQGAIQYLDKPLDFPALARSVFDALDAGASGHLEGITLPTLLQMVGADRKTCTVHVRSGSEQGLLFFSRGELVDAELGALSGEAATLALVAWEHPAIEILGGHVQRPRRIERSLPVLLLEALRLRDEEVEVEVEEGRTSESAGGASGARAIAPGTEPCDIHDESEQREGAVMSATDKLKELSALEGFAGAAVFTPTGEPLAVMAGEGQHLKEVGVLANNVLLNAQKASVEMGTGRGQQVHVEAEKAHIFARCLNEGSDPLKSLPGKAHIHLVLVLKSDSAIGLAKLRVANTIEKLAEDFRM